MLKNVVLPAPFGPISDTTLPRGTVNETLLTATRPPNTFRTSCASRIDSALMPAPSSRCRSCRPCLLGVVERLVVHSLVELERAPARRDEALGPEQHHDQDDRAVDAGRVELRVDVRMPAAGVD